MEQQRNKFEYRDLGKNGFFSNPTANNASSSSSFQQDKLIAEAVSDHFIQKFEGDDGASMCDIKTHKVVEEHIPDIELSEIKTHSFSEDGESLDEISEILPSVSEMQPQTKPEIDLENVKNESYQQGYAEAKLELEAKLNQKADETALYNLLQEKLSSIEPKNDDQSEVLNLSSGLIAILAKKLHLAIPADFEAILLGEMMPVLNKYYKKGKVIAKLHPDRVDYCNNLFRIGELPKTLSENIEIVPDESVPTNDCSIEWQDATLVYSQEDLLKEAEAIIEHLKIKIEN